MSPPSFSPDLVGRKLAAITPNDSADLPDCGIVYVGVGGDISVVAQGDADGTNVLLKNVPTGVFLPVVIKRVRATGTTATNLVLVR